MKNLRTISALVILTVATGCRTAAVTPAKEPIREALYSLAWVQTSAEYDAISIQTWRSAGDAVKLALRDVDTAGSAAIPGSPCTECPPAVIVDVDETILDNTAQDARRMRAGEDFDPVVWTAWVNERNASAVPGALDFVREVERLGVRVFYVTNRTIEEEPGTRDNLEALGFKIPADEDVVLTKGEFGESSDKSGRRAEVSRRYRVLVMVGDDLGDFIAANARIEERDELLRTHSSKWGRQWFVLPNPVYGSWERALLREVPKDATREQKIRTMFDALDYRRDAQ